MCSQKTDPENPKWYMVDLTFRARAKHFVSLSLLKRIGATTSVGPPSDVDYIGEDGLVAIKSTPSIHMLAFHG
jgi:hypothetical protein